MYSIEMVAPDCIQAELLFDRIMSHLPGCSSLPGFDGEGNAKPGEVVFELQITLEGDAFKFSDSLDASLDFGGRTVRTSYCSGSNALSRIGCIRHG